MPGAGTAALERGSPDREGTQVLAHAQPAAEGATGWPAALLSRRSAAEVGMYAGALLMGLALAYVAVQGWPEWDLPARVSGLLLGSVALIATGLFVRLPWERSVSGERRRAVSALLTVGVGLGLAALGVLGQVGRAGDAATAVGHAVASVVLMLGACAVARSPFSEVALLGALAWAAWLVVPPGTAAWATLVGLGVAWVGLAARGARGRRTAAVAGTALALVASAQLGQGQWAWPVRAALAALAIGALVVFGRGGPNPWLALAAGAAAALAGAIAGGVLGPALALFIGGLATMVVSWVALRAAGRGRPQP